MNLKFSIFILLNHQHFIYTSYRFLLLFIS